MDVRGGELAQRMSGKPKERVGEKVALLGDGPGRPAAQMTSQILGEGGSTVTCQWLGMWNVPGRHGC